MIRWKRGWPGAILAFWLTTTTWASTPADVEIRLATVANLNSQGQPDKAMAELLAAMKQQPNQIPYHMTYIELMVQVGKRATVEEVYASLLAKNPKDPTALFLMGQAVEDPSRKLSFYQQAQAADGKSPWPWLGKAGVALSGAKAADAIKNLEECLKLAPTLEPALEMLATLYALQGKIAEAITLYETLRREDQSNPRACLALANLYNTTNQWARGVDVMKQVVVFTPADPDNLAGLAFFQLRVKDYDGAVANYSKVVGLAPQDETPRLMRESVVGVKAGHLQHDAVVAFQDGALAESSNPQEALRKYGMAVDLSPKYDIAWVYLARLLGELDKPDEALKAMGHALQLTPNSAFVQLSYGQLLLELGQALQAEQYLRQALILQPNDLSTLLSLAVVYTAVADAPRAEQMYRSALPLAPAVTQSGIRINLAGTLSAQGKGDEAARELVEVLRTDPNNLSARLALGTLYLGLERFDEAELTFQAVLKQAPNSSEAKSGLEATRQARVLQSQNTGKVKCSQILVGSRQEADNILAELKKGADFAQLARTRSAGPEAGVGGDLGYVVVGDLDPALGEALTATKVGAYTGVVQTKRGYHILLRTR